MIDMDDPIRNNNHSITLPKDSRYDFLLVSEIQNTITRLSQRIEDRFPRSGLGRVCQTLYRLSQETPKTLVWIARVNPFLRGLAWLIITGVVVATLYPLLTIPWLSERLTVPDLIQTLGSALEGLAIACAGILFVVSYENRRKRLKIIRSINHLRCLAHIIDAHQLTKDPETLNMQMNNTPHSPRRDLSPYEMNRYLDYCCEMLALTSKLAFLYIQEFHDPEATKAVNDLENLTTDLSQMIWQKIVLLRT